MLKRFHNDKPEEMVYTEPRRDLSTVYAVCLVTQYGVNILKLNQI